MSRYCTQCGKSLSADWRFCEFCGAPLDFPGDRDRVIGHVLAEKREAQQGRWGRPKVKPFDILFTPLKLLFIRETDHMNAVALQEGERVHQAVKRVGISYRNFMDDYQWNSQCWQHYYTTALVTLLAESRENWALENNEVTQAVIRLDEDGDMDELELELTAGRSLLFDLFMASGGAAARFLRQVLGGGRVKEERKN